MYYNNNNNRVHLTAKLEHFTGEPSQNIGEIMQKSLPIMIFYVIFSVYEFHIVFKMFPYSVLKGNFSDIQVRNSPFIDSICVHPDWAGFEEELQTKCSNFVANWTLSGKLI